MSDELAPQDSSVPTWYWIVAVAALLFELAGAYLYANSLMLDPV